MKKVSLILVLSSILCLSCTNYDYGPTFSLKSPETKITGEWKLTETLIEDRTNILIFEEEKNYQYSFTEDRTLFKTKIESDKNLYYFTGFWSLSDDKSILMMNYTDREMNIISKNFEILRLSADELWILDYNFSKNNSNQRVERRFKKL